VTVDDVQPGSTADAQCHSDAHCITCGDEGIPMRVLEVDETRCLALCETEAGERSTVEIALVDAGPGDRVLVHAGTAIA
jgi:hydrogenase expression/formation protein HypC